MATVHRDVFCLVPAVVGVAVVVSVAVTQGQVLLLDQAEHLSHSARGFCSGQFGHDTSMFTPILLNFPFVLFQVLFLCRAVALGRKIW